MGEDENTPRFPWQLTWEAPKPLEEELNQYSTPEERETRALEGARRLAATSLRSTSKPAATSTASRAAVPIAVALPATSVAWPEILNAVGSVLSVPAAAVTGSLMLSGDTSPEEQEYIRLLARERVARNRALGREHAGEIPVWMTTLDAEKAALPKRTSITVPFRPVEGYVEQPPYMATSTEGLSEGVGQEATGTTGLQGTNGNGKNSQKGDKGGWFSSRTKKILTVPSTLLGIGFLGNWLGWNEPRVTPWLKNLGDKLPDGILKDAAYNLAYPWDWTYLPVVRSIIDTAFGREKEHMPLTALEANDYVHFIQKDPRLGSQWFDDYHARTRKDPSDSRSPYSDNPIIYDEFGNRVKVAVNSDEELVKLGILSPDDVKREIIEVPVSRNAGMAGRGVMNPEPQDDGVNTHNDIPQGAREWTEEEKKIRALQRDSILKSLGFLTK